MLSSSLRRRGTAVALLAAALALGAAAPATALSADDAHCILLLDDGTVVCGASVEEADAAFTAATGYTRVADEAARGEIGTLAVYSLASLYPNNGYGGSGYTFVRTTPCNGSTVSGVSDLSTVGLNNTVSSFQTYGTCQVRLSDGTGYTGTTYGYTTSSTSLGSFNDLASSAQVR